MDVRDERRRGWFWIDNALFDDYAPRIGPAGVMVYAALARRVDRERQCFPSIGVLADTCGLGRSTIKRALGRLAEAGLIRIEHRTRDDEGYASNLYVLVPVEGSKRESPRSTDDPSLSPLVDRPQSAGGPTREQDPSNKTQGKVPLARERAVRTLFAEDFVLTDLMAEAIRTVGCLDPPAAFAHFADTHRKKASRFADWPAAWRTWIANHGRYGCPCQRGQPLSPLRPAWIDDALAKAAAMGIT